MRSARTLALIAALAGGGACGKPALSQPAPEVALLPIVLEVTNYFPHDFDLWIGAQGQRARKIGTVRGHRTVRFVLEATDLPPLTLARAVLIGPGLLTVLPEIFAKPGDHLRFILHPNGPTEKRPRYGAGTAPRRGPAGPLGHDLLTPRPFPSPRPTGRQNAA